MTGVIGERGSAQTRVVMVAAILKWIMRKKSVRPGSWVDRLLGVRGWELMS